MDSKLYRWAVVLAVSGAFTVLALEVLLTGCAPVERWQKPEASQLDFNHDDHSCQIEEYDGRNVRPYKACMKAHGWHKIVW